MTEVLATLGPCCGILRRGMNEPNVMHNGLCREKHDGCLGPTIYLVDAAEVDRLRAEIAEYRAALEQIVAPFEDLNFVSGNKLLTYIHDTATAALAAKGE